MKKESKLQENETQGTKALPNNPRLNLVSVHSYKGGVGKTTIALVTATALARQGLKVCLVDLDLLAPGLYWFLRGKKIKRDIGDFLFARLGKDGSPAPEVTAKEVCCKIDLSWADTENIYMVPARPDLELGRRAQAYLLAEARSGLMEARVEYMLRALQREFHFDLFVVDAPPSLFGTSDSVRRLVEKHCGVALQIVTPTGPDLSGTRNMILELNKTQAKSVKRKTVSILTEDVRPLLVLNRAPRPVGKNNSQTELASIVAEGWAYDNMDAGSPADLLQSSKAWLNIHFRNTVVLSESTDLASLVSVRRESTHRPSVETYISSEVHTLASRIMDAFSGGFNYASKN